MELLVSIARDGITMAAEINFNVTASSELMIAMITHALCQRALASKYLSGEDNRKMIVLPIVILVPHHHHFQAQFPAPAQMLPHTCATALT
jgi:hypothetical protein